MKLFLLVQKYYQAMGIHPTHSNGSPLSSFNVRSSFLLISMLLTASATMATCIFQTTANVFEHTYTLYVALTQLCGLINFLISLWTNIETISFIEGMEVFIQRSEFCIRQNVLHFSTDSHNISCSGAEKTAFRTTLLYSELNDKIERITRIIDFVLAKLSTIGAVLPSAAVTLINHFIHDDELYQLPFPVMLPFDWKNPFGYVMALVFVGVTAYCVFFSAVPTLGIAIGSSILANSAIDVAASDVNKLNEMTNQGKRNHSDMLKHFCSIVEDISDIRELSRNTIHSKVSLNG